MYIYSPAADAADDALPPVRRPFNIRDVVIKKKKKDAKVKSNIIASRSEERKKKGKENESIERIDPTLSIRNSRASVGRSVADISATGVGGREGDACGNLSASARQSVLLCVLSIFGCVFISACPVV